MIKELARRFDISVVKYDFLLSLGGNTSVKTSYIFPLKRILAIGPKGAN